MDEMAAFCALIRSDVISHRRLADGTGVVVELHGGRVITLNRTAMRVVEMIIAGCGSIEDLARGLAAEFEVDELTARRDIEGCLAGLHDDLS